VEQLAQGCRAHHLALLADDLVEGAALAEMPSRYERLVVPAGGKARWHIEAPHEVDAWLTVKLAYHGRVEYRQVRLGPAAQKK